MREYYFNGLTKEKINDLNITKAQLYSLFTDLRKHQPPSIMKPRVCMDWCYFQPWRDKWMQKLFKIFDVHPCNNREVPQYFLRKLWAEFLMGEHVNYFDIAKSLSHGLGSSQVHPATRRNPLRGSLAPKCDPKMYP